MDNPPITQETFDQVVNENIEDLDMDPEEAVTDAIEQLTSQNANMLYIIREQAKGENNQHLCLVLTLKLNSISEANMKKSNNESSLDLTNVEQTETLISLLNELTVELKTDKLPKRYYACKTGKLYLIIEKFLFDYEQIVKTGVHNFPFLNALAELAIHTFQFQPDMTTRSISIGLANLLKMLPYSEENSITFIHLLKLVSVISLKHEANRVDLYHAGIFNSMGKIFTYELNNKTLIQLCKTIRNFTVDDDPRQTTCRAHDNARDLVNDEQALEQLCKFLKNTDSSSFICKKEIILTLSKLLVRNEFCLKVAQDECGLINLIRENLIICLKLEKEATGDSSEKLNESASTTATATSTADSKNNEITLLRPLLLLLKAMCGNDEVKYQVSQTENMIENIVSNFTKYMANVAIVDGAITCLQMLTLRQVAVVNQLIKLSVPHLLIQAIQIHGDNRRVILNGAYLIRNLVARTRENQKFFINLDIESILNKLIGDFKNDTNVYQAIRAAQRDLDLDAGLKEQWTGAPGASKELEYD